MNAFGPLASPSNSGPSRITRVHGCLVSERLHQPATPQPSSFSSQLAFPFSDDSRRAPRVKPTSVVPERVWQPSATPTRSLPLPLLELQAPVVAMPQPSDRLQVRVLSRSIERNSNFESLRLIKLDENKDRNAQPKQISTFAPYAPTVPKVVRLASESSTQPVPAIQAASPQINFYESVRLTQQSWKGPATGSEYVSTRPPPTAPGPRIVRIRTSVEHGANIARQDASPLPLPVTGLQRQGGSSAANNLTFRKHVTPPSAGEFKSYSTQTLEPPASPFHPPTPIFAAHQSNGLPAAVFRASSQVANPMVCSQTDFEERPSTYKKPILKKRRSRPKCDTSAPKTVKINETLNEKHEFERYNFNGQRRMREGSYFEKLQREEEARVRQEIAKFKAEGSV